MSKTSKEINLTRPNIKLSSSYDVQNNKSLISDFKKIIVKNSAERKQIIEIIVLVNYDYSSRVLENSEYSKILKKIAIIKFIQH